MLVHHEATMKRQGRGLFSALAFFVGVWALLNEAGVRWKPHKIVGFAVSFAVMDGCA
jgi:hypothetical protein